MDIKRGINIFNGHEVFFCKKAHYHYHWWTANLCNKWHKLWAGSVKPSKDELNLL